MKRLEVKGSWVPKMKHPKEANKNSPLCNPWSINLLQQVQKNLSDMSLSLCSRLSFPFADPSFVCLFGEVMEPGQLLILCTNLALGQQDNPCKPQVLVYFPLNRFFWVPFFDP